MTVAVRSLQTTTPSFVSRLQPQQEIQITSQSTECIFLLSYANACGMGTEAASYLLQRNATHLFPSSNPFLLDLNAEAYLRTQISGQKDCVTQSLRKQSGRGLLVRPEEGSPKRQEGHHKPSSRQTGVLASASMLGDAQNGLWSDRKLKKRFICFGTPDRKLIMTGIATHLQFAGGDFLECIVHDFVISDDITGHGFDSIRAGSQRLRGKFIEGRLIELRLSGFAQVKNILPFLSSSLACTGIFCYGMLWQNENERRMNLKAASSTLARWGEWNMWGKHPHVFLPPTRY
ncbi:hypothetical protein F5877DRAFT_69163 [Lentinula edodes]|nr:hypothetical protein F5877DRAFT_69163 [Lentinula edodes]